MLYCVKCKIDYEDGKKFCKQCGSKLESKETASTEASKGVTANELPPKYCLKCSISYSANKNFCPSCGSALTNESAAHSKQQAEKSKTQQTIPNPKIPYSKIGVMAVLIIILSVGGFFGYKYFFKKDIYSTTKTQQPLSSATNPAISETAPKSEELRLVFENIRKANLTKDINLFMSCYSKSFIGVEERKNKALSNWIEYDFTELTFTLSDIEMRGDTADVKVDWKITAKDRNTGSSQIIDSTNLVTLKNEGGQWKIITLR